MLNKVMAYQKAKNFKAAAVVHYSDSGIDCWMVRFDFNDAEALLLGASAAQNNIEGNSGVTIEAAFESAVEEYLKLVKNHKILEESSHDK